MDISPLAQDSRPEGRKPSIDPSDKLPDGFRPSCWALFKIECWEDDQQPRKVTYSPKTLRRFKWREAGGNWEENQHLFGTFEEARKAYEKNSDLFDGYGYILQPDEPMPGTDDLYLVVTDLDGCRDSESGRVEPWAMEIVEAQDTFTEVSPSGIGLHLIGLGKKEPGSKMVFYIGGCRIENYGGGVGKRRFMTYTGVALYGYDKPLAHEGVQRWIDVNVPKKKGANSALVMGTEGLSIQLSDDVKGEILRICEGIKSEDRGRLFAKLYHEGDFSSYTSRSEAEIALLNFLAWATVHFFKDEEERKKAIAGAFVSSAFYRTNHREQWDREGYLFEQIDTAIADCTSGYTGKPKEQILHRLEALRIDYDWRCGGRDKANARAVYGAHLALAYNHGRYVRAGEIVPGPNGEWYPMPETGVLVHSPVRTLSLISGVLPSKSKKPPLKRDYRNITHLNLSLEGMGLVRRIYKGVRWGTASLYLLPRSVSDSHPFSSLFSSNTHKP